MVIRLRGGGDNDSLQTDSLQADDATKHTEEYIRQRIQQGKGLYESVTKA